MEIWVCRGLVSRQLHFIFGVKSNPMSPKRRLRNRGKGNLIFDMQSINQLYGWSAEGSNKWRRKASLNLKVSKQLIRRTVFSSIKTPNFLQWREIWLLFWGFVPRVPGARTKWEMQRNTARKSVRWFFANNYKEAEQRNLLPYGKQMQRKSERKYVRWLSTNTKNTSQKSS